MPAALSISSVGWFAPKLTEHLISKRAIICVLLLMTCLLFPRPAVKLPAVSGDGTNCSQRWLEPPCGNCTESDLVTALHGCMQHRQQASGNEIFHLQREQWGLTLVYDVGYSDGFGLGNHLSQFFQGLGLASLAGTSTGVAVGVGTLHLQTNTKSNYMTWP